MKNEESMAGQGNPIVIESTGMRMTVDYRRGAGDEGLTFDVTAAGAGKEGARILRFDCFMKTPHYHIGPSSKNNPARDMKEEGIQEPVRWTLEQLKTRLPDLVKQAGYEEVARAIDQKTIADRLTQLEGEIIARSRPRT